MYTLVAKDREILRTLAQKYMEMAVSPAQIRTQKLWASLNNGNMERPMFLISQIPWHEMDVDGSLICQIEHPYWRGVENSLRQSIYSYTHMPADMTLPPYIMLPYVLVDPNYRGYGMKITQNIAETDFENDIVSHDYINQFETMEDVEKIKFTKAEKDVKACDEVWAEAQTIFAGVAPIQWKGVGMGMALWDIVAMWMSVEECYYQLVDEPELLHAIMERATQVNEAWIDQLNEQKMFDTATASCHCSCTLTKPYESELLEGTAENAWGSGMAQLFTSVSPATTAEFEIPYMTRLFKKMGNIYYGCCERLDDRLDMVCAMPNIRKVSCSPWSHKEAFAEKLPKNIIMSNKPNPAFVGTGATMDTEVYANDLKETIKAAKDHGTSLEMILKDNSSVQYQPQRLWEASRIAMGILENY